jgi:hypothetical protein
MDTIKMIVVTFFEVNAGNCDWNTDCPDSNDEVTL